MATRARVTELKTLSCSAAWRNYYFVKITTDDGVIGWSEFDEGFGSPGVGFIIEKLAWRVIGQSAFDHERIHEDLRCATRPAPGGVVGQALGAIENALLDAKAKTLGVPCYDLLGGKIRDQLRVYWSHCVTWRVQHRPHYQPEIVDVEGVKSQAREVREKGFSALKTNLYRYENGKPVMWEANFGRPFVPELNIDRNVRKGIREHLTILREAAGPGIDIMVDLNFNAKTEGYLQILNEISDLDLYWVELDTPNAEALAFLRSRSKHPIASCETVIGLRDFVPFFRQQAINVAIVDAPWNGVWQSMKIAAAAEAYEVNVACHNFYGHLCTMMNAHFCAAIPNLRIMEVDVDRIAWDHELFTHVPTYQENGHLAVPNRPGWGTEPIEAALSAHPPIHTHGLAGRAKQPN